MRKTLLVTPQSAPVTPHIPPETEHLASGEASPTKAGLELISEDPSVRLDRERKDHLVYPWLTMPQYWTGRNVKAQASRRLGGGLLGTPLCVQKVTVIPTGSARQRRTALFSPAFYKFTRRLSKIQLFSRHDALQSPGGQTGRRTGEAPGTQCTTHSRPLLGRQIIRQNSSKELNSTSLLFFFFFFFSLEACLSVQTKTTTTTLFLNNRTCKRCNSALF